MTRKVHVKARAVILVPVEIALDLYIVADERTNVATTAYQWSRGLKTLGAQVEDVEITKVIKIGKHDPDMDGLELAMMDRMDASDSQYGVKYTGCGVDPTSVEVTDSR